MEMTKTAYGEDVYHAEIDGTEVSMRVYGVSDARISIPAEDWAEVAGFLGPEPKVEDTTRWGGWRYCQVNLRISLSTGEWIAWTTPKYGPYRDVPLDDDQKDTLGRLCIPSHSGARIGKLEARNIEFATVSSRGLPTTPGLMGYYHDYRRIATRTDCHATIAEAFEAGVLAIRVDPLFGRPALSPPGEEMELMR